MAIRANGSIDAILTNKRVNINLSKFVEIVEKILNF
jgi:hypothetical protein